MDVAYDRVTEESLPTHSESAAEAEEAGQPQAQGQAKASDLNQEVREAYKTFTESAWGVKLGGLWGNVRKQGEQYAQRAQQELVAASNEASKGFTDLVNHTQSVNLADQGEKSVDTAGTASEGSAADKAPAATRKAPESLLADIGKEAQSIFGSFRSDASKVAEARLKQVRAAEDAADEALLKFGIGIKSFLRDAIVVTAPDGQGTSEVLFESKDSEGRRKVHATRFDAQLHVIHTSPASFSQDPTTDTFTQWKKDFSIDKKTADIASDLQKYEELRQSMEKLVPEKVEYAQFWTRYYFLRHVVETEEQKRRELLKSQVDEEEVAWDDDDDDEDGDTSTPMNEKNKPAPATPKGPKVAKNDLLKPSEGRRSNEHSVADSDASYDLISGTNSRGPGSPKEAKAEVKKEKTVTEESDEEDWE